MIQLLLLWIGSAFAHESRPAYLELVETSPALFDVTWRRPALADRVLSLHPDLPCDAVSPVREQMLRGSIVQRWRARCDALVGSTIAVDGLSRTLTDVLVRVEWTDGSSHQHLLRAEAPSWQLAGPPSTFEVARDYTRLGVEHILGGVDHLLFVFGLLLLVPDVRRLVQTLTAFTIAHSVTLAGATLGFVSVPQAPVEAVIALSILFLATEIAKREARGTPSLTERFPWAIALTFGLLHGFGFAGALSEVGLPSGEIPVALLAFNMGVELGQLGFVGAVFALGWVVRRLPAPRVAWARTAAAYGIGTVAAYWTIERVAGF
jgi:hydrogenase/urease accessory protein HupE